MTEDKNDNIIPFHKHHGFDADWDNIVESTYDLLRILRYCVSDEMKYSPEAKEKMRELIDYLGDSSNDLFRADTLLDMANQRKGK